jgi:hypothetical protein
MHAHPARRYRIGPPAALLMSLSGGAAACAGRPVPAPIDLLAQLPSAERRAVGDVTTAVRAAAVAAGGDQRRALVMRAPARVTWDLQFPARGRLTSAVALVPAEAPGAPTGVTARVVIVGGRTSEPLATLPLHATEPATWTPVDIDLSAYSGWQWSLFYRPGSRIWRVLFAADATPGGQIAWAEPQIDFRRR